jgi:hypothetical protein
VCALDGSAVSGIPRAKTISATPAAAPKVRKAAAWWEVHEERERVEHLKRGQEHQSLMSKFPAQRSREFYRAGNFAARTGRSAGQVLPLAVPSEIRYVCLASLPEADSA